MNNNLKKSHAFSDSNLINYTINKKKKLNPINQVILNSDFRNIFHKKKSNFDIFSPNPNVEEIPAFSFENDRNIKNYKNFINNKSAVVEKNEQDYVRYIKKFEKPKQINTLNSPYIFYQKKTNSSNNNINYQNKDNELLNNINNNIYKKNNNHELNTIDNNNNKNKSKSIDINNKKKLSLDDYYYLSNLNSNNKKINLKWNYFNTISKINVNNDGIENEEKNKKTLIPSLSSNLIFSIGNNEISNPSSYYKKYDEEYYRYRLEQKKYLDYNYNYMMNNEYLKHKKEPNVNPYNPKNNILLGNKSNLMHNPILNPVNHYGYNKYLRKELNNRENEKFRKFLRNFLYSNKDSNIDENNIKKEKINKDNDIY